jgi:hypothetical protein
MADYRKEFPDFDPATMPAIPKGFEDTSWHNDSAPSFLSKRLMLRIFVDYADPEQREIPETKRFSLSVHSEEHSEGETLVESDDFADLLPHIVAAEFAALLREDLSPREFKEMKARNAVQTDANICHSHDFCDANMVMDAALRAVLGDAAAYTSNLGNEDDRVTKLWNAAWAIATPRYLSDIVLKDCSQDGGTFYREPATDEPEKEVDGNGNSTWGVIASYPEMVKHDHDMDGAQRARERFAKEHPAFIATKQAEG